MSAENPTLAEQEMTTRLYEGSPSLINDTLQDIAARLPTAVELEHISVTTALWAIRLRSMRPTNYQDAADKLAQIIRGEGGT